MAGPPLSGATAIDYRGSRFALGRTANEYGIWDLPAGGGPALTFPLTHDGWAEAWRTYRHWEETAGTPAPEGARLPEPAGPVPVRASPGGTEVGGPLTFANVIEIAARLYGRFAPKLILLVAVVVLPLGVLQVAVLRAIPGPLGRLFAGGLVPVEDLDETLPEFLLYVVATTILGLAINGFLTAAITGAAVDATGGRDVSIARSARTAVGRLHSVMWILVLEMLAVLAVILLPGAIAVAGGIADVAPLVVLGAIVAVVVVLFVVIRLLFSVPILMTEDRRGWGALRRSWALVEGRWWRTFGILLLVGFLAGLVGLLFQAIATAGASFNVSVPLAPGTGPTPAVVSYLGALAAGLASSLTVPFVTLVIVLLYLDARFRTDARMGGTAGPGA